MNLFKIKKKRVVIFSHQVVQNWRRGGGSESGALSFLTYVCNIYKETVKTKRRYLPTLLDRPLSKKGLLEILTPVPLKYLFLSILKIFWLNAGITRLL